MNKRRFNRISLLPITSLTINDKHYENVRLRSLSVTGVLVEGSFERSDISDKCVLEMKFTNEGFNLDLKLSARIIRITDEGVAFEFVYSDTESLILLETIILYNSDNPMEFAQEFPEEPPELFEK